MAQGFTTGIPVPLPVNKGGTGVVTSTGTGSAVLSDAPTFTTGITTPKITFNSTSGIIGTTTNDNAAAGSVGEILSSTVSGVAMAANVPKNITSISITSGDWDVYANVYTTPAAGTTTTYFQGGINTVSATIPTALFSGGSRVASTGSAYEAPTVRISTSSTITIYLVANVQFGVSTMNTGGTIFARRVR